MTLEQWLDAAEDGQLEIICGPGAIVSVTKDIAANDRSHLTKRLSHYVVASAHQPVFIRGVLLGCTTAWFAMLSSAIEYVICMSDQAEIDGTNGTN